MATAASADTLRLQTNIPEVIALQFADGLLVSSPKGYGDQVKFTLTDGRKVYLPPIVADKIASAGIRREQPFELCKREVKDGNRRFIEYTVEPLSGGAGVAAPAPAPISSTSPLTQQSHASNGTARLQVVPAPVAAPPPPPVAPVAPAASAPSMTDSAVALMKLAGCGAIDAVLEIEKHAQSRGMTDFAFGADNIQKLAACLFIELCKKAGRQ